MLEVGAVGRGDELTYDLTPACAQLYVMTTGSFEPTTSRNAQDAITRSLEERYLTPGQFRAARPPVRLSRFVGQQIRQDLDFGSLTHACAKDYLVASASEGVCAYLRENSLKDPRYGLHAALAKAETLAKLRSQQ